MRDGPECDDGHAEPDRLEAGQAFVVQLGGEHDRAGRVHRRDHGDQRQQPLTGRQQVADVGDDGQRAGAEPPAGPPVRRSGRRSA